MAGPHPAAHRPSLPMPLLGVRNRLHGTWAPQLVKRKKERRLGVNGNLGAQRIRIPSLKASMRWV